MAALASMPVAAQTVTIAASGNCAGTPANCGTSGNRNGDRDTSWPGLQVDEGDIVTFTFTLNNPPTSGAVAIDLSRSGSAYTVSDLQSDTGNTLTTLPTPGNAQILDNSGPTRTESFTIAADGSAEGDEDIRYSISRIAIDTTGANVAVGSPSSVTVTIRGTDSAPSFGTSSVSAKTFTASAAIMEFQVPAATGGNGTIGYAASGLPAGLRFDATGTDTPGCPGTEPREVCGTPTTATSGAQTVTITATDADSNTMSSDSATLTFSVTVNAGASLASNPATLTEANLDGAALTVTLAGVTFAAGVSATSFELVTSPTIAGLSINSVSGSATGTTTATLTLAAGAGYGFDAAATIAVRVLAAAHSGSTNLTTGTLSVAPSAPAGVTASQTSLSLNEDPGATDANQGTYTLALNSAPAGCSGGVGVSVATGNPDVTVNPDAMTFTATNWNMPQTVTVTAQQDADGADDRATLRHTVTTACAAAGYAATLAIPSVQVAVDDDDAPPPPNQPPAAVGAFADVDLDPGERVEVGLLGRFRDPEGGPLSHTAESLNPEVASAVVSNDRLWVEGRSAGLATVLVRARDVGGLSAHLPLRVRVGRVLSFAKASAFAPEGGAARFGLELSRPSERAVVVGYVLEADGDPGTADADAEDHGGSEGAITLAVGETEAFIEVPILDDGDIEPAREFLRVRLLPPDSGADWALGLAAATVAVQEGVCDRSPAVREALRGSGECWAPSVGDLAGRGYLDLRGRGIASLRPKDLLGLSGLRVLHLHGNRLSELPEGLFAGLGALERLRLDGNRLGALPAGLFGDAGRLSSLDLSGNLLRSLPPGLWEGGKRSGAAALSRLDLSGNRIESLPAGFFEGLSGLSELDLSGNPGAPFTLTMELARTDAAPWAPGPAAVEARVREGAPFALSAGVRAEGSAELSTGTARIGAGEASSAPIVVSPAADGEVPSAPVSVSPAGGGTVRLSLAAAPEVPSELCGDVQDSQHPCFQGIRTAAGPGLLLFKRPPRLLREMPGLEAESLGGAAAIDLAEFFKADGGESLFYAAESSDPSLASVSVDGGVLAVTPNDDGREGFVTITVMATDADGLAAEASFAVEVLPESRPFASGWRLGWLKGAAGDRDAP